MKLRSLGDTGIDVSEIGLGAWQLANPDWGLHDKAIAHQIICASLDAGCNFFDTAPGYGYGRSEELLGQALKSVRHNVVICTKFSHYSANGERDFSVAHIRPTLEASLRRLQTDYVDVLLLHNPPRDLMDGRIAPQYGELEALKAEGKVRVYGVSLDWREEAELVVQTTQSRVLEVMYNALYQEPAAAFPQAQARGVGLIVKVPLDSGWLSGRYNADSHFDDVRSRWSPAIIARRGALVEKLAALLPPGTPMAHAALQYTLARPEVSTVIPGAKSVEQVRDNFAAANNQLPSEVIEGINALWVAELKDKPLPW